jgi:hypothetical protein
LQSAGLAFIAELKHRLEEQLDLKSGVSCEVTLHQLNICYRGESVGSWQATEEGALGNAVLWAFFGGVSLSNVEVQ